MFESDGRKKIKKSDPPSTLYSELKLSDALSSKLASMQNFNAEQCQVNVDLNYQLQTKDQEAKMFKKKLRHIKNKLNRLNCIRKQQLGTISDQKGFIEFLLLEKESYY